MTILNKTEKQYLSILKDILDNGIDRPDRTGTGSRFLFGKTITHDYKDGFPLLTTKKMFTKGIIYELLWFLKGTEDASMLIDNNVKIWDGWMKEDSDGNKVLPHTYGTKWRDFGGVDQIANVTEKIKDNPNSRRHIVSAWDPRHIGDAALPWCHILFQFNVVREEDKPPDKRIDDGKLGDLNIATYQRSADFFLGVPFNIASYSFLLYMVCEVTGYRPGIMYYTFGDSHVYHNHIEQCKEQILRTPYNLPQLEIKHRDSIDDFVYEDFKIVNYEHHPKITGAVSI